MDLPPPSPLDGDQLSELQISYEQEMMFEFRKPNLLLALVDFTALAHECEFGRAFEHFELWLQEHVDDDPVVAVEVADLLLKQGDYGKLTDFVQNSIVGTSGPREELAVQAKIQLFQLMNSLAAIFTTGALRSALVQAKRCRYFMALHASDNIYELDDLDELDDFPNFLQIYMFEIYLRIIVFALQTSNWAGLEDLDPPWSGPASSPGTGALVWFDNLRRLGHLMEASRVLRTLLPILHMLSPGDVEQLVFSQPHQQQHEPPSAAAAWVDDSGEEADFEVDAKSAINLSRAQSLLDRMIREFSPSGTWRLGCAMLYIKGQDYLDQAGTVASEDSRQPHMSRVEIPLEQRDYSMIGRAFHLDTDFSEPQAVQPAVGADNYPLRILDGVRKLLLRPAEYQSVAWQRDASDILDCQTNSGNRPGCVRVWELLATVALSSLRLPDGQQPARPLLASERDVFQLLMMDASTLPPVTDAVTKDGEAEGTLSEHSCLQVLSRTASAISEYGFADSCCYERLVDDNTSYPLEFDIPLHTWAYMKTREQLKLNGLLLDGSASGNDDPMGRVDMNAVKSCLPAFVDVDDEPYKKPREKVVLPTNAKVQQPRKAKR